MTCACSLQSVAHFFSLCTSTPLVHRPSIQVSYCENNVECRRVQILHHFDEEFDGAHCNKSCDNCCVSVSGSTRDVTAEAQAVVRIVQHMNSKHAQCRQAIVGEVFRASKSKACASFTESVGWHRQVAGSVGRTLSTRCRRSFIFLSVFSSFPVFPSSVLVAAGP